MASGDIIRLGGGTDFLKGTFSANGTTPEVHQPKMVLDILGKGIVTTIRTDDVSGAHNVTIEVDGRFFQINLSANEPISPMIPFNEYIKISDRLSSGTSVGYILF